MTLTLVDIKSVAIKVIFNELLIKLDKKIKKQTKIIDTILQKIKEFPLKPIYYSSSDIGDYSFDVSAFDAYKQIGSRYWPDGLYEMVMEFELDDLTLEKSNTMFIKAYSVCKNREEYNPIYESARLIKTTPTDFIEGFDTVWSSYFGHIKEKPKPIMPTIINDGLDGYDIIDSYLCVKKLSNLNKKYIEYLVDLCGEFPFFKVFFNPTHNGMISIRPISIGGGNNHPQKKPINFAFFGDDFIFDYFDFSYLLDEVSYFPKWVIKQRKVGKYLLKLVAKKLSFVKLKRTLLCLVNFPFIFTPPIFKSIYEKNKNYRSLDLLILYKINAVYNDPIKSVLVLNGLRNVVVSKPYHKKISMAKKI